MKYSLNYLYKEYPRVQQKINGDEIQLTNVEDIIMQLAMFIRQPDKYSLNVGLFYKTLEGEDLTKALSALVYFFQSDTYLIKDKESFIFPNMDKEKMYNQTNFARYLKDEGLNWTQGKIAMYLIRDNFPAPQTNVNGKPYWYESTVKMFAEEEKIKQAQKNKKKKK